MMKIYSVQFFSRFWESLTTATCCKSLVVVYGNDCLLQIGVAAESSEGDGSIVAVDVNKLTQGSLYKSCMQSSKRMNYLFHKSKKEKKIGPPQLIPIPALVVV